MILVSREPRLPPKSLSDVPRFQGSWCPQLSSEREVVIGTRTEQSAGNNSQPND